LNNINYNLNFLIHLSIINLLISIKDIKGLSINNNNYFNFSKKSHSLILEIDESKENNNTIKNESLNRVWALKKIS
jgi:hypothetical protein